MPVSGGGSVKLPQVKTDFTRAAAKPAPKSPAPPALNYNPPKRVAVAAPAPGKGVPMVPKRPAGATAPKPAPPKAAAVFKKAAQPGLKPAFKRAATPPPAIRAKQNFAKAAAGPAKTKAPQPQKIQTRNKTK